MLSCTVVQSDLFVSDSQDYSLPSRVRASTVTVPGAELVASHVGGQKIVSDILYRVC